MFYYPGSSCPEMGRPVNFSNAVLCFNFQLGCETSIQADVASVACLYPVSVWMLGRVAQIATTAHRDL